MVLRLRMRQSSRCAAVARDRVRIWTRTVRRRLRARRRYRQKIERLQMRGRLHVIVRRRLAVASSERRRRHVQRVASAGRVRRITVAVQLGHGAIQVAEVEQVQGGRVLWRLSCWHGGDSRRRE